MTLTLPRRRASRNSGTQTSRPGDFIDGYVSPDYTGWDPPGASVVAWVATHCAAAALLLGALVATVGGHGATALVAGLVWISMASGLVVRIIRHLLASTNASAAADGLAPPRRTLSPNSKIGAFQAMAALAFLAIEPIGQATVVLFAGTVSLTSGVRIAGLDAWSGRTVERFGYVRRVCSLQGFGFALLLVASVAISFWLGELTIGRIAPREAVWIIPEQSWRARSLEYVGMLAALTPPTVLVCEAIALAGRYEAAATTRLLRQEQELHHARFAGALHDRALATTRRLLAPCTDDERRHLAAQLEVELRRLQREIEPVAAAERPIRGCLVRALERANEFGVEIELDTDRATLDVVVRTDEAELIEALTLEHVTNSFAAGANTASLGVHFGRDIVEICYVDDAGGFDPSVALERDGGLARLVRRTRAAGGTFGFDANGLETATRVRLPVRPIEGGEFRASP